MQSTRMVSRSGRAAAGAVVLLTATALLAAPSAASAQTLTVFSSFDDDRPGTLRGAIAKAADGDTIVFDDDVRNIAVTGGELVIDEDVTIRGHGSSQLTIRSNGRSRVFFVAPGRPGATDPPADGPELTIEGVTIADGRARGVDGGDGRRAGGAGGSAGLGGALFVNQGEVTLRDVAFEDNAATGGPGSPRSRRGGAGGSGVGRPGWLNLENVAFRENRARGGRGGDGAADGLDAGDGLGKGAALFNLGDGIKLDGCITLARNSTGDDASSDSDGDDLYGVQFPRQPRC